MLISAISCRRLVRGSLYCILLLGAAGATFGQVSPAEILNPKLKAAEEKYLPQLKALHGEIRVMKFPFPFALSRYVGVEPAQQAGADSRGLEFVYFHNRLLLKISGNYNAAYSAQQLTQNERASHTFEDVIAPVLQAVVKEIPADVDCDGIGFEIAYHTRSPGKNYEFEGKEILVVVFDRADAFDFANAVGAGQRQEILNRSEIYSDGKEFGLALGQTDALNVDALARSVPKQPVAPPVSPADAANAGARLAAVNPNLVPSASSNVVHTLPGESAGTRSPASSMESTPAAAATPVAAPQLALATADAEKLQSQFQPQLDALAKVGATNFHFVDYAPPSFAIYHGGIVLQLTIRNPATFEKNTSSIYRRAAQSFDLFLGPLLKGLVEKLPAGAEYDALDVTVLNQLGTVKTSSEADEFICPIKTLRAFVNDEITSQDLVNQSIVLVNGVRIALNLQLVE